MEHCAAPGLGGNLLVPGKQRLGQALPAIEQSSGGDVGVQVRTQDVAHLADGYAQAVVEPTGEGDQVVPQRGVGHRIGYHRLDVLFTRGAVVAMDRMFGDDRRDLLGNVFDDACALAFAALQLATATRADLQAVLDAGVDLLWRLAARAFVSILGPRLLAPPLVGRRLFIHRNLTRGRGGQRRPRLQPRHMLGHRQRKQRDGFGSQRVQRIGLLAGKHATFGRIKNVRQIKRMSCGGTYP